MTPQDLADRPAQASADDLMRFAVRKAITDEIARQAPGNINTAGGIKIYPGEAHVELDTYAITEAALASLRALAPAPVDQSDAGRDGVIEEVKQAIFDILCPGIRQTPEDDETYRSVALAATRLIAERCAAICDAEESNYLTRMAQSIGERARYKAHANVCRKMAALIRTLAPAPSEAPKPPGQEPGGDPGVRWGEEK